MKAYELKTPTRLRLTKVTPRKEIHGDERVQAVSLRLRQETTNEALAALHPGLLDMLFYRAADEVDQQRLDVVPATKPNLRCPIVKGPLKLDLSMSGYTVTIDHGIDDTTALQLYLCELDKFEVEPTEGGSVAIAWSLASNKQITPELIGALCDLEGAEIEATQVAPVKGDTIDGSVEAFRRDHPETDTRSMSFDFDAENGGTPAGDEPGDGADGEGSDTDATPAGALAAAVASETAGEAAS